IIRIVDEEEYVRELDRKLCEEVEEYRADGSIEEMADVLEVLQAICIARGYTLQQLEEVRRKKAAERGGFKKRIYWEGNQD
ncbi:MAG: nucleoside triphosphate pyrophosphohydrolase, partial [Bulleidia sp.]|nr:nucleoside triphosphate pyrophosphohydrolase [Bulleidia sp.]